MSIVIINVSTYDDLVGLNHYVVRINSGQAIPRFAHVCAEGLAECLRKAADAVGMSVDDISASKVSIFKAYPTPSNETRHGGV